MPILSQKKVPQFLLTIVIALFGLFSYLFYASRALAQVPPPTVECDKTDYPEFHSLRPYQASPCHGGRDLAIYCGNDLILQDTVRGYYDSYDPNCKQIGDGKVECSYTIDRQRNIAIDVSGVDLPISGNTEDVINSQGQNETLSDADKVNNYISWYLNGVNGRAEYPFPYDMTEEDAKKIVDFSGPLNKLLPQSIQLNERVATIENVLQKDFNNDSVIGSVNTGGGTRHDQVVGCVYNAFGLLKLGKIVECYPSGIIDNKREFRLSDFEAHIPPFPWEDQYENNFPRYYHDYQEWKGKECIWIPILKIQICVDSPFRPNYWGNLFKYIPFSSTEDREGSLRVKSGYVQATSEDTIVSNVKVQSSPAPLYFAHQEENKTLSRLLQTTYVARDNLGGDEINPKYVDIKGSDHCSLAQIRSNPGDNLFPGEIFVALSYKIDFICQFDVGQLEQPVDTPVCHLFGKTCYPKDWTNCSGNFGRMDCPVDYICADSCQEPNYNLFCEKTANIYLSTETKTPGADTIWGRLVAGASSVFKRFFPKMGEDNSPIKAVFDIPAASKVTYTATDADTGAQVPIYAQNPAQRIGQSPELYFPHLGGVEEYFLHAIQTALRPKGYGYNIVSGNPSPGDPIDGQLCEAPSTPPDAGGSPRCELGVGYCSPENLRRFFPDERTSRQASIICNAESGGDPSSINCGCLTGTSVDYSIGLFQINLLAHCAAEAFTYTWNPPSCTILDEAKVNECAQKYFDADNNIEYAAQLYQSAGWQPWSTYLLTNAEGGCREQIEAVP